MSLGSVVPALEALSTLYFNDNTQAQVDASNFASDLK
jgi:hypothetical protein